MYHYHPKTLGSSRHSWQKFKIVLVRKPGRKLYYFMAKFQGSGFLPIFESKYQGSGFFYSNFSISKIQSSMVFPSNFWIQFFKVVVFPSNFWNTTVIWQFFWVILNFAQECYIFEIMYHCCVHFWNFQKMTIFFVEMIQSHQKLILRVETPYSKKVLSFVKLNIVVIIVSAWLMTQNLSQLNS